LGWSHGDQEEFTIEEMIQHFDFDHVQKSSAVFNVEKLNWVNGVHMRKASPERLAKIVTEDYADQFKAQPQSAEKAESEIGLKLVALIQQKVKLLKEIAEQLVPLCTPGAVDVDASGLKWLKDPALKTATQAAVAEACEELAKKVSAAGKNQRSGKNAVWGTSPSLHDVGMDHTAVDAFLRAIGEKHGVKLGDLAQPMRLVVSGRMVSAGLFDLMAVLPWDVIEPRLHKVASL
jgi:glutamyl-tRNA synthetase